MAVYSIWKRRGDAWNKTTELHILALYAFSASPSHPVVALDVNYSVLYQAFNQLLVYGAPFQPEVRTLKVSDATQTGLDGSTKVSDSVAAAGRKGLRSGTWNNRFLVNDAGAQTLADNIAKVNLQARTPIMIDTKGNPKYEPWDIITVTIGTEYVATEFEVIGTWNTMDLNEGGGGHSTRLTLREWTA